MNGLRLRSVQEAEISIRIAGRLPDQGLRSTGPRHNFDLERVRVADQGRREDTKLGVRFPLAIRLTQVERPKD